MVKVYSIDGITPVVHPSAFVHPSAVLIGDVIVGPRCYVGPAACLRGDFGRIVLEEGVNVQDACVMHSYAERDAVIEAWGHIGHGAILHGCHVGRNAMVGMNAVVMDGAVIGEQSLVAARRRGYCARLPMKNWRTSRRIPRITSSSRAARWKACAKSMR
jgi:phenylacetic acid degradation protein